jgi:hypothetical protein
MVSILFGFGGNHVELYTSPVETDRMNIVYNMIHYASLKIRGLRLFVATNLTDLRRPCVGQLYHSLFYRDQQI